jgi:hypothetical protein
MIDGAMLVWFALTAMSVAFVAFDIRSTPESIVLKWGFVLVTPVYGAVRRLLLRPWLPRTAAGNARTVRCMLAGDRCSDRRCIASPATASGSLPAR